MPILRSTPIPPLYTVYILRSTVRNASLYIGSTPNPQRRLKQHNGDVKGGAARTARDSLRPWEMVGIVSGFPGMVAALKFEWALANPHLSLHIPSESRITKSTKRKRSGRPRRPPHNIKSILSNLHLLLRVPSFARWPLNLHFFAPEVHRGWESWCATVGEPLRDSVRVFTDFEESPDPEADESHGVHALPLNYAPLKEYVAKARSIFEFEREGACAICRGDLPPGEGLYAVCPNTGCESVGHLSCWSRHMLGKEEGDEAILPVSGRCPGCSGQVTWGEMMKELSLRVRGPKEVEKLLKKPRKRKARAETESDTEAEEDE